MTSATNYPHYFKPTPYAAVDVYRVLALFDVTHPAIQHAAKKVLCAGARGTKAWRKDIEEARDSLQRALDMDAEDLAALRVSDDGKGVASPLDLLRENGWSADEVSNWFPNVNTEALDKAYADAFRSGTGFYTVGVDFGPAGDVDVHFTTAHHPAAGLQPAAVGVGTAEHKAAQAEANERATKALKALDKLAQRRIHRLADATIAGADLRHYITPGGEHWTCGTDALDAHDVELVDARLRELGHTAKSLASVRASRVQDKAAAKAIDALTGGIAGYHGRYLASLAANKKLPMHTFIERVIECLNAKAKAVLHNHGDTLSVDGYELTNAQRQALAREMKRRRCSWSFE